MSPPGRHHRKGKHKPPPPPPHHRHRHPHPRHPPHEHPPHPHDPPHDLPPHLRHAHEEEDADDRDGSKDGEGDAEEVLTHHVFWKRRLCFSVFFGLVVTGAVATLLLLYDVDVPVILGVSAPVLVGSTTLVYMALADKGQADVQRKQVRS